MGTVINKYLTRLTKDPKEQNNIKRLGVNMMLQNADLPLYTGTEIQAFQVSVGLTTGQMGGIGLAGAITSVIIMLLSTCFVDKVRNRVKTASFMIAGMSLFPLILLIMCLGPESFRKPQAVQSLMVVFIVVNTIFCSFYGILWATIFSRSIRNKIRGRFMGIVGVVGGIAGMLIGLISASALKLYGFPYGFAIAFSIAVVLVIISSIIIRGTKELSDLKSNELPIQLSPLENLRKVAKMRQFRILMPANVLRGLGDGAGCFAMAVGMKRLGLSLEYAGYTTSLVYLAGLFATILIGLTVDRFGGGKVIPRVEIFLVIGLMGMVLASNSIAFLAFFLLWQIMITMEGIAIPLIHFEIVPVDVIGAFSSLRLLILAAIGGISSFTVGYLLEFMSPVLIYALCAGMKLAAGALYWYGVKIIKGEQKAAMEIILETSSVIPGAHKRTAGDILDKPLERVAIIRDGD